MNRPLPLPDGQLVRLNNDCLPYLVDVTFYGSDADEQDRGLVETIHRVYRWPDLSTLKAEQDPDELVMDDIHEELNRGKWEPLGSPLSS